MTEKKPKSEAGKVFPWFRIFASDFLSETGDLTPSEAGVYIKLLAVMHLHAEPIVDDIGRLARRVGADMRVFKPARAALIEAGLIISKDGKLWSALSEGELEHITARSQIARSNVATRHQKGKQKQGTISTDVDKTRAVIRDERLEDQFPSETDPSSTSYVSDSDDALARDGAGPQAHQVNQPIDIPVLGSGNVYKIVSRRPYTIVVRHRAESGQLSFARMQWDANGQGVCRVITRDEADALPSAPGETTNDRSA
ncbi:DUF1376 domain-containing protein [Agrobacterium tumefaciens]|uniref:DUF1376 domain-containing protein n=1 Tax=Agrobacterium tumefaciens TaxID=358 RepID=UPI000459C8CE|nr:DUF1376 domain-containing protein [Agrobacterium tumefaciens]CDN92511.1 hypothetical protein BN949_01656 [Agrobacterium tumefaciens]